MISTLLQSMKSIELVVFYFPYWKNAYTLDTKFELGNSADKLRHPRPVGYSAKQVLLN